MVDAILAERFLDLGGELARRFEDERARHARPRAALLEGAQHRQRERRRLAGAGLGDAEDVAPLQGVGNSLFLDRRRRFVAGRLYGVEHFLAQAEFIKSHCVSQEQGYGQAAFGAHGDGAAFPGRALAWRSCNGSRRVEASVTPLTWGRYSGIPAKVNETRQFYVAAARARTSSSEDWLTRLI